MRLFKSRSTAVVSALIAFATLALAELFANPSPVRADEPEAIATPSKGRRRVSALHAGAIVVLLALGATAFAAHGEPAKTAEAAPAITRLATTTTSTPPTTVAPTTVAPTTVPPTTVPPTAPPTTVPVTTPPPPPVVAESVHGACGGNLPPCCVMMRESGGNPTAVNPSSGAAGKWQFMPSTWANYKGYASPVAAPESVQDERAAQVWAGGAGAGNWVGDC